MLFPDLAIHVAPGLVFNARTARLLRAIEETGSLVASARRLKLHRRTAGEMIKAMDKIFSSPLVITSKGGAQGGGSTLLTEEGRCVLVSYERAIEKAREAVKVELHPIGGLFAKKYQRFPHPNMERRVPVEVGEK
jgi:molybdate transport system regulatory protein